MTNHDLIHYVVRRSASDAVFRAIALCDPVAALAHVAREHGLVINARRADAFAFVGSRDDLPPDERSGGPIAVVLPRPCSGDGVVQPRGGTTARTPYAGPQNVFSSPTTSKSAVSDAGSTTGLHPDHPDD